MNLITKAHLSRRTMLRGMGVGIALPLLDAMLPAQTPLVKSGAKPLSRMAFVYVPHGAIMDQWTPAAVGSGFAFTPILKPLEPFRERLVIVSGLAPVSYTHLDVYKRQAPWIRWSSVECR